MGRVIFLLEEPSMKALLDGLLPRLYPGLQFACITHEGKYDLEKSIPRKLRSWREPGVSFIIVQDNDNGDCLEAKRKLLEKCKEGNREDSLVRIVCQELEAWYIGEPDALAEAFGLERLRTIGNQSRYRDPDGIQKPSIAIKQLVPGFSKTNGARMMARRLSQERNRSRSFAVFIEGIEKLRPGISVDSRDTSSESDNSGTVAMGSSPAAIAESENDPRQLHLDI